MWTGLSGGAVSASSRAPWAGDFRHQRQAENRQLSAEGTTEALARAGSPATASSRHCFSSKLLSRAKVDFKKADKSLRAVDRVLRKATSCAAATAGGPRGALRARKGRFR